VNSQKQIVVLDDSAVDVLVFEAIMKEVDCKAFITLSYKDAVEFCRNNHVDILISDLNVGEDSGFSLMSITQDSPNHESMKRIICSADSPAGNNKELRKNNVIGWIVKPVNYEAVLKVVNRLLSKTQ